MQMEEKVKEIVEMKQRSLAEENQKTLEVLKERYLSVVCCGDRDIFHFQRKKKKNEKKRKETKIKTKFCWWLFEFSSYLSLFLVREQSLQDQLRQAKDSVATIQKLHELAQSQLFEVRAQSGDIQILTSYIMS
jgi:homeobox protein cut-like